MHSYAHHVGNATVSHTTDTRNPDRCTTALTFTAERVPRGLAQALRKHYGKHVRVDNGGDTDFVFHDPTRAVIDSIIKLASTLDEDCYAHVMVME